MVKKKMALSQEPNDDRKGQFFPFLKGEWERGGCQIYKSRTSEGDDTCQQSVANGE